MRGDCDLEECTFAHHDEELRLWMAPLKAKTLLARRTNTTKSSCAIDDAASGRILGWS